MPLRSIIIGGGITGLSAGYELVQRGVEPTLFDGSGRLGGVIQTETVEGCVVEGGPDSFLSAKPAGLELIRELGLANQVIGSNDKDRVTYIVKQGRLLPMPDGLMMMIPTKVLPLAATPLLGWGTKLRMGLDYFRRPGGERAERTVAQFIEEHYGREAVDYLADPLLSGVYGGSADSLSVNSVLARFVELESKYGSLTRGVLAARRNAPPSNNATPLFQTLKGGLADLVGKLIEAIGGRMRVIFHTVQRVERASEGTFRVFTGDGTWEAERLIFACPAWRAGTLLAPLHPRLGKLLSEIEYSSSLTLAIGLNRSECGPVPPGFGFLVPKPERRTMVACTFTGAKFPYRAPDDKVVMRCFLGGAGQEAVLDTPDESLLETVCEDLRGLLGWKPRPAFYRVSRWRRAMAQYTLGHRSRVDQIRIAVRDLPGVHLAGNAYDGIGIPDCIRTGRQAATEAAS